MGKSSRRKKEQFTPVEIKIIHTDQRVHLKDGQHIIPVVFDFNPDKHDPDPWDKMTRLAPVDFIGTRGPLVRCHPASASCAAMAMRNSTVTSNAPTDQMASTMPSSTAVGM